MLLLVSMVLSAPRAAKVTGAGHSGLKGLRSLRDGLRPPLTREPLPPPGRVCIGRGATEQTVAPPWWVAAGPKLGVYPRGVA